MDSFVDSVGLEDETPTKKTRKETKHDFHPTKFPRTVINAIMQQLMDQHETRTVKSINKCWNCRSYAVRGSPIMWSTIPGNEDGDVTTMRTTRWLGFEKALEIKTPESPTTWYTVVVFQADEEQEVQFTCQGMKEQNAFVTVGCIQRSGGNTQ